jgi:hypothetical protein
MDGSPKVYFVSIFFDGRSKQAAVTKIQILVASLVLGVLIVVVPRRKHDTIDTLFLLFLTKTPLKNESTHTRPPHFLRADQITDLTPITDPTP